MNVDQRWVVHRGDCLDLLKMLPDASVDLCLTDPPYGTTNCKWDSVIDFAPMWNELKRVVKERAAIVLFSSQPFTSALVMSNPKMFRYSWVWDKKMTGNPFLAKVQPLKIHEDICVFSRKTPFYSPEMVAGEPRTSGGGVSQLFNKPQPSTRRDSYYPKSIIQFYNSRKGVVHPTQKPTELLRYLIRTYTNEGDTVLDFTCGSGSTGVASLLENRKFIGIEKESEYVSIATKRISAAV
jgi:DNA modification methylase